MVLPNFKKQKSVELLTKTIPILSFEYETEQKEEKFTNNIRT